MPEPASIETLLDRIEGYLRTASERIIAAEESDRQSRSTSREAIDHSNRRLALIRNPNLAITT